MAETGLRLVRLGEFAWARLEPAEGQYDFDWLDRAIEILAAHGLHIVLGTPTAAPPPWLTRAYPAVLPVDRYRHVLAPGTRRHYCANSPIYRRLSQQIVTALAAHYGRDSRIVGWQIDNEIGSDGTAHCYCDHCAAAFRDWLRGRYGGLSALNEAWGTAFWSTTYGDWEEIPLPWAAPTNHSPGHLLDFHRFASDSWTSYLELQVQILRRLAPEHLLTHNMGFFSSYTDLIDGYRFATGLDLISWDNYQHHGATPSLQALVHDLTWGLKQRNFWVTEQQAGHLNWTPYNSLLAPGEVRLKTYQSIAHGASAVFYFRWRPAPAGSEQYHSGLLDHAGRSTRGRGEVMTTAGELARLAEALEGTEPSAEVALLHDFESRWALQIQPHNRLLDMMDLSDARVSESPLMTLDGQPLVGRAHLLLPFLAPYEALRRRGLGVAVLHPQADLSPYPLVIAPALHVVDERLASHLEAYVNAGGTLVLGPRAGVKDGANRMHAGPPPGPLATLAGVTVSEFDGLSAHQLNSLTFLDGEREEIPAGLWCELLTPDAAAPLAIYQRGFYADVPAITCRAVGSGRVYYVGTMGGVALYQALLERIAPALVPDFPVLAAPDGVEVMARSGTRGRVWFVLNHSSDAQWLELAGQYSDLLSGRQLEGRVVLQARDVLVLGV
jgi:beta-galactosidase